MSKEKQRSILDRIENIDRRVIFLIVLIAVVVPLIRPLGLPLSIANESRDYYNVIKSLPDGAKVLIKCDMEAGTIGEIGSSGVATLKQLWEKHVKIVFVFFDRGDCAVIFTQSILPKLPGYVDTTHIGNKVYGTDWVSLGYIEGHESAMQKLAANMIYSTLDQFGSSLASMPIMRDIKTAGDFDLLITIGGGDSVGMLNQFVTPYHLKAIVAAEAVTYVYLMPYYKSGIYSGILNSMKGAAEYEFLLGKPGLAIVATDSLSIVHIVLLTLIVIANIIYIYRRRMSGGNKRVGGEIK
jgi:hypothetical protein